VRPRSGHERPTVLGSIEGRIVWALRALTESPAELQILGEAYEDPLEQPSYFKIPFHKNEPLG
jgi:hypothetical protein